MKASVSLFFLCVLSLVIKQFLLLISGKSTNSSSSASCSSTFSQQALTATNAHRTTHCAPALTCDADLSKVAQAYADKLCASTASGHSYATYQGQAMGENLYQTFSSSAMTAASISGKYLHDQKTEFIAVILYSRWSSSYFMVWGNKGLHQLYSRWLRK